MKKPRKVKLHNRYHLYRKQEEKRLFDEAQAFLDKVAEPRYTY